MADGMTEFKKLTAAALVVIGLAVIDIVGIAVLNQFKSNNLVDNATVDSFITGLAIFGGFVGVLVIAVVGKAAIALFRSA